jgi:predicted XRE-type DNA-binding protein
VSENVINGNSKFSFQLFPFKLAKLFGIKQNLMTTSPTLITDIERYIAQHSMNRAKFSELIGVSAGTVDKLLGGHLKFSDKMLTKIEAKTGLLSHAKISQFDFEVSRPERSLVTEFEGEYQALRPSFREGGMIHGYIISITWDDKLGGLVFEEKKNDLSPNNKGVVSIPLYNRMMYLLSCVKGNFRLAILSDGYEPGIFYGVKTTVSSQKMIDKIPTSALLVIKKLNKGEEAIVGITRPDHPSFESFSKLLEFGRNEGFFRVVR